MVATERRKLAETIDELKELQAEREALRNALRLVESQSHSRSATPGGSPTQTHTRTSSSSSSRAVKSPQTSRPGTPDGDDDPTSAGTIVTSFHRPTPLTVIEPPSPAPPKSVSEGTKPTDSRDTTLAEPTLFLSTMPSTSEPSPSPTPSQSPSPKPSPSPSSATSESGEYFHIRARALDFLPREASPWADSS